ncbi:MAG: hypothetical protein HOM25_10000 [Rhodospirillaceae bacterium]|jgi:hypothetical protein|nr:hypothetical protein [Rhodospirillaceae bacterium]MBT5664599.1 hypothetical protein [Rhodospirillaceae bacterium]MBT5812584.1 hypothetical protein [Rhodospirillaceae bacterium]
MTISVAVSWGELIDKITILEIKRENMTDPDQLANVGKEYELLTATRDAALPDDADMENDAKALKLINETLWKIEDDIRDCERAQDFGETFIDLARSVYRINDRRAGIKRRINETLGSELVEEKSYRPYD